jgi:hypothetical protein
MQIQIKKSFWVRTGLAAAALAGALIFIGAPAVRADEGACQRRIAKADHRLHEAAEHHKRAPTIARGARVLLVARTQVVGRRQSSLAHGPRLG